MRVTILGNCQAQPLAAALTRADPGIDVVTGVAVHEAEPDPEDRLLSEFAGSDVVLAQRVSDSYPTAYLRTRHLRAALGDRLVVWPNVYYRGYNPEYRYLRRDGRHLEGPLGDYHLSWVVDGWLAGRPVADVVADLRSVDANAVFADVPEESLADLRSREADVDVPISDHIEEWRWATRLCWTFNHPTQALLDELAARVLRRLGVKPVPSDPDTELLGRWRGPLNPWVREHARPRFADRSAFRGCAVDLSGPAPRSVHRPLVRRGYADLVTAFYEVYDVALARD